MVRLSIFNVVLKSALTVVAQTFSPAVKWLLFFYFILRLVENFFQIPLGWVFRLAS